MYANGKNGQFLDVIGSIIISLGSTDSDSNGSSSENEDSSNDSDQFHSHVNNETIRIGTATFRMDSINIALDKIICLCHTCIKSLHNYHSGLEIW
jgi:hypothetical protein